MGYQVGSGIILGLPGQELSSVAADLLLCRDEDYEMVSIGPFIPHPDTPLGNGGESGVAGGSPKAGFVTNGTEASTGGAAVLASVRTTIDAVAVARLLVPRAICLPPRLLRLWAGMMLRGKRLRHLLD